MRAPLPERPVGMPNRHYYRLVRKGAEAEADLTRELIAWLRRHQASYRRCVEPSDSVLSQDLDSPGQQGDSTPSNCFRNRFLI